MSKDISTMFTKEEKKNGRTGYGQATREKDTIISPAQYGAFLQLQACHIGKCYSEDWIRQNKIQNIIIL